MFKSISSALTTAATGLLIFVITTGCDQQDVEFPDESQSSGSCGPWYAGGDDTATTYGIQEGDTLPCVVWTSVKQNNELTRINIGELYLDAQQGLDDRKALIVMISGAPCPACGYLIEGLLENKEAIEDVALIVGLNKGDPFNNIDYDIHQATNILVEQEDWPADWAVTNDVEDYYMGFESFPWIQLVRLSDMKVMDLGNGQYTGANVDDLVATIEAFE